MHQAAGVIDLPTEGLDLVVTAQVGNVAPVDIQVAGTLTHPKSKVRLGKFLMDHVLRLPAPQAPVSPSRRFTPQSCGQRSQAASRRYPSRTRRTSSPLWYRAK